jgi:hypothetical protein
MQAQNLYENRKMRNSMRRDALRRDSPQSGLNFIRNDGVGGSNPSCGTSIQTQFQTPAKARWRRFGSSIVWSLQSR